MSKHDKYPTLRATLAELADALTPDRNARVESGPDGLACVCMDDAGQGEFSRVITDNEATELVRLGLCRDAR